MYVVMLRSLHLLYTYVWGVILYLHDHVTVFKVISIDMKSLYYVYWDLEECFLNCFISYACRFEFEFEIYCFFLQ